MALSLRFLFAGLLGRINGEISALEEAQIIEYSPLLPCGVRCSSLDEQVR